MTEKQLDHKIAMEQKALNAGIQSALRGQIIAAFLFLTVLGVGTYMIYTGKDVGGWSLVFVALVGVITSFALGAASSKQQKTTSLKIRLKIHRHSKRSDSSNLNCQTVYRI